LRLLIRRQSKIISHFCPGTDPVRSGAVQDVTATAVHVWGNTVVISMLCGEWV